MTNHEKRVEYLLYHIFEYFTELHTLPFVVDPEDRKRYEQHLQEIHNSVCQLEQYFHKELLEADGETIE